MLKKQINKFSLILVTIAAFMLILSACAQSKANYVGGTSGTGDIAPSSGRGKLTNKPQDTDIITFPEATKTPSF
jgi:hypothetical protein